MSTPLGHDRDIRRAIATVCLSGMLEDKLDAVAGAGFDGIEIFENNHVALTQPFDYFDEAALFCRAVLGLAPTSDTEFAVPFGPVRGRAASAPSGCVRIALQRTLLRRGEWAPAVQALQHVAFATADLFATARALRERGVRLLTVSNNYYQDFARFALDPALIEAMCEFGILYDREEGGEFYHLCTRRERENQLTRATADT